jgi:hypothetical protein
MSESFFISKLNLWTGLIEISRTCLYSHLDLKQKNINEVYASES